MGSKRVGLARTEALLENLKRNIDWGSDASLTGFSAMAGTAPATVTAAGTAAALTEGVFIRVDSGNNAHKVKMFLASHAGQMVFITNIDDAQDAVVRNNADDATLITLGEGKGCMLISTASGDNWAVAITGA